MKILSLTLPLLMIAQAGAGQTLKDIRHDQDYLQPTDRSDEKLNKYRNLLEAKLGITPFDCGRVIIHGGLGGRDSSVSVSSRRSGNGGLTYWVTLVEADNLWEQTNGTKHLEKARRVKVKRVDATIPTQIAQTLKEVWSRMLHNVRARKAKLAKSETAIEIELIGLAMGFSLPRNKGEPLRGEFPFKPQPGTRTYALMELSDALYDYCQADDDKREAIGSRIQRDAKRLLARL
jgi:hypothetical protein